jgi:hypothetical protein
MDEDDVAKTLSAALAKEGEHVDDGRFTLDPAAAHRKLREHQLADPHGYVLLLVEAAWLAAKQLDRAELQIWLGPTSTFEFSGIAFAQGSLRELFAAALGGTHGLEGEAQRSARVLQLLGLAVASALTLDPKCIVIEASDASGASERVRIDPNGALTIEPSKRSAPGKVRFEFRGALLAFNPELGAVLRPWWTRATAERELLEQCCRHTQLGVRLGDELISRRSDVEPSSAAAVMLDGRKIGVVGHSKDPYASTGVWIVNRGIAIADPPSMHSRMQVVVEVDLPMDISRKQILQGPELDAVRRAIADARSQVAVPPRAEAKVAETPRAMPLWLGPVLVIGIFLTAVLVAETESRHQRNLHEIRMLVDEYEVERPLSVDEPEPRREQNDLVESLRTQAANNGDRDPLRRALVLSCYSEPGPDCLEAAWYYHYNFVDPTTAAGDGDGDVPATDEAALLERGCNAGVRRACRLRDLPPLRDACQSGDAYACYGLGLAGYDHRTRPQSIAPKAVAALDRACDHNLGEGCYAAGVIRLRGIGMDEDLAAAEQWFERGCVLRNEPSCAAERFTAECRATEPELCQSFGPNDPSFPRPAAPKGSVAWTP